MGLEIEPLKMLKAKAGSARRFIHLSADKRSAEMADVMFEYIQALEAKLAEKEYGGKLSEAGIIIETYIRKAK